MDITLITGAPCSGKTELAKSLAGPEDIIIDADLIAQALGSRDSHNHPGHTKALAAVLRDVATNEVIRLGHKAYVVSASPTAETSIPHTEVMHCDPGMAACLERAKSRPSWTREAIKKYYTARSKALVPVRPQW